MTAVAYICGVLHGDGWCTKTIGLRVSDKDFADAFAVALELATGFVTRPRRDERGYWLVRNRNDNGRFSHLKDHKPTNSHEQAAWLRGLFDSEGNAQLTALPSVGENSYDRRVAFYSTNTDTLDRAQRYLADLGIETNIYEQTPSDTRMGTKPVFELKLKSSRKNYLTFAWTVGSSISRKQDVLFAIPLSYQADPAEACRRAQRIGAKARHRKTVTVTLPAVVEGVRQLISRGEKPTQRACGDIPGFWSVQRYVRQADLVAMARGELPIGITKNFRHPH